MTGKKRVHEIAKDYGLTGQDLTRRLNDWGFPVKSHMTAVDDMDMLRIQGMLEANGFSMGNSSAAAASAAPASGSSDEPIGGLIVRRKKKKTAEDDAPAETAASAPAPQVSTPAQPPAAPEPTPALPSAPAAQRPSPLGAPASAPPAAATGSAPATGGANVSVGTPAASPAAAPARREAVAETPATPGVSEAPVTETAANATAKAKPAAPAAKGPSPIKPTATGSGKATEAVAAAPAVESAAAPAAAPATEPRQVPGAAAPAAAPKAQPPAAAPSSGGGKAPTSAPAKPSSSPSSGPERSPASPGRNRGNDPVAPPAAAPKKPVGPRSGITIPTAKANTREEGAAPEPNPAYVPLRTAANRGAPAASKGGSPNAVAGTPNAVSGKAAQPAAGVPASNAAAAAASGTGSKAAAQAAEARSVAPAQPAAVEPPSVSAANTPAVAASAEAAGAAAATGEVTAEGGEIVRPSTARRGGKVVGFIDLATRQTDKPVKRESRRLGAGDDATVNVQPTRGNTVRRMPPRPGEASGRSDLTTAQLREREAGRVLRRGGRTMPQAPTRGGRRGGGGGHGASASGSPMAGGAVKVEQPVTVKKLADAIAVKQNEVLRKSWDLLGFGAVNINSVLDEETAMLVANEFDVELEVTREVAAEEALLADLSAKRRDVDTGELVARPPTVAVLGHVDHGKTTLIDALRKSSLTHAESGGITQHIGAYQIETKLGHKITVVDTPGHAAFTAMRARGARAVDLVILVVAADDGVMPQTAEAINHARAAKVPVVVAMNKIDKVDANPDKVLSDLAANELIPEQWGGTTAVMPVSALKGLGLDELMERVFLEGELLELRSHPTGPASGVVLEAEIQQGRGIIAHLLIQDGSLKRGDVILAGEGYGKVRAILDDRGNTIEEAGPAKPVEVTGLDKLPGVGERFHVVPELAAAKEVAEDRSRQIRMSSLADRRMISRDNLFQAVAESEKKAINLLVKADVQGSVEVLRSQLAEMQHDEIEVKVLHAGVGPVSESDVDLAITSDATILAFHVGTNGKARQNAERGKVEIRNYEVIYVLLDDVRKMMEGSLTPEIVEEITGHVEIRRLFKSSRIGNIAGSHVIDGKIFRDSKLRLLRDGIVVFTGQLASLRRESDDVKDVREGFDCGIVIRDYNDIREGDIVEAYKLIEVKRKI